MARLSFPQVGDVRNRTTLLPAKKSQEVSREILSTLAAELKHLEFPVGDYMTLESVLHNEQKFQIGSHTKEITGSDLMKGSGDVAIEWVKI